MEQQFSKIALRLGGRIARIHGAVRLFGQRNLRVGCWDLQFVDSADPCVDQLSDCGRLPGTGVLVDAAGDGNGKPANGCGQHTAGQGHRFELHCAFLSPDLVIVKSQSRRHHELARDCGLEPIEVSSRQDHSSGC